MKRRTFRSMRRIIAVRLAANVFCPTGPGGGVDPSCSPGGGGTPGGGSKNLARPLAILGDLPVSKDAFSDYLEAGGGREWQAQALPNGIGLGKPKECYKNASMLVIEHSDLDYVEGIAYSSTLPGELGFLHAWAVTKSGKVVDNTWKDPEKCQYYGIKYDRAKYLKHLVKTMMFGVFGGKPTVAERVLKRGGL